MPSFHVYCFEMVKYNFKIILIIEIIFIFLSPANIFAQLLGTPVEFCAQINEDEEGKKISFPSNVFFEPLRKEIYVIDGTGRIVIYNYEFYPLYTLEKSDGIETPQGIATDKQGNIYIAQSPSKENPKSRITILNACMELEKEIYINGFEGSERFIPARLAINDSGIIYIAGNSPEGIIKFSNEGMFLGTLSPQENGKKILINDIKIDNEGNIYLVSEEEGHIYVYDKKERFLFRFGEKGGCSGKLSRPQAIGIDSKNNRLYVVDYMRHTVTTYDRFGKYIFEFGGLGWGEGWFQYPKDITVDNEGRILVADTFNDRIQALKISELFIKQQNLAQLEEK